MGTCRVLSALSALLLLSVPGQAATYYVANGGDDAASGNQDAPWQTLQQAADTVAPGDTVIVRPGSYAGFNLERSGTAGAPITFSAQENVEITEENPETPDGINLEGASYVVVEGFMVNGMERAGLRAVTAEHVTLRHNQADGNGRWGILTGFVDDLLIEDNHMFGSLEEHGIYVGNSGDRPSILHNVIWNNAANGIHMNGDAEQGGDGIISDALVEGNVIYSNGTRGGSGINCDGVQDSLIVNNLIYDARASGISLYRIDGGGPSTGNQVINNTVVVASSGRWALNIQDDSSGTTVYNNIFLNSHPSRGAINLCGPGCEAGLTSDYNVVVDRFTRNDSDVITLSAWRAATAQDQNSAVVDATELFVDAPAGDYHLTQGNLAVSRGTTTNAPDRDLEGNQRPSGDGVDIGAYEVCDGDCVPAAGGGGGSTSTGGAVGASGASGADGETGGTTASGGSGARSGGSGARSGSSGMQAGSGGSINGEGGAGAADGGTVGAAGRQSSGGVTTGGSAAGNATTDADSGCSCRVRGGGASSRWVLFVAGALLVSALRRRGTDGRDQRPPT